MDDSTLSWYYNTATTVSIRTRMDGRIMAVSGVPESVVVATGSVESKEGIDNPYSTNHKPQHSK